MHWASLKRVRGLCSIASGLLSKRATPLFKLGGNGGEVEVDETFIDGKARNMHLSRRRRRLAATGVGGKVPVVGILERNGEVRLSVIPNISKKAAQDKIKANIKSGSPVDLPPEN